MASLYELTGQALELLEMAEEGVLDQKIINDTLEGLEFEIEEKADCYAKIINELNGDVALLDAEIKRLTERKNSKKSNIESLRKNLENSMIALDKKKFKTPLFSFGIQKNPASVEIDNEDLIPNRFIIHPEPKLDKAAIKAFIKDKEVDWAHLNQTESLRIR
ncbi:MAG: siphovirus Gp157 family protein [Eubacteriales bacterium]